MQKTFASKTLTVGSLEWQTASSSMVLCTRAIGCRGDFTTIKRSSRAFQILTKNGFFDISAIGLIFKVL